MSEQPTNYPMFRIVFPCDDGSVCRDAIAIAEAQLGELIDGGEIDFAFPIDTLEALNAAHDLVTLLGRRGSTHVFVNDVPISPQNVRDRLRCFASQPMKMAKYSNPEPGRVRGWERTAPAHHRCVPLYAHRRSRDPIQLGDQVSVPCYKITEQEAWLGGDEESHQWMEWSDLITIEGAMAIPDTAAIRARLLRIADDRQCSWCPGFTQQHVEATLASLPKSLPLAQLPQKTAPMPISASAESLTAKRLANALTWLRQATKQISGLRGLKRTEGRRQVLKQWTATLAEIESDGPAPKQFLDEARPYLAQIELTRPASKPRRPLFH